MFGNCHAETAREDILLHGYVFSVDRFQPNVIVNGVEVKPVKLEIFRKAWYSAKETEIINNVTSVEVKYFNNVRAYRNAYFAVNYILSNGTQATYVSPRLRSGDFKYTAMMLAVGNLIQYNCTSAPMQINPVPQYNTGFGGTIVAPQNVVKGAHPSAPPQSQPMQSYTVAEAIPVFAEPTYHGATAVPYYDAPAQQPSQSQPAFSKNY